jgi:hypothetical protein
MTDSPFMFDLPLAAISLFSPLVNSLDGNQGQAQIADASDHPVQLGLVYHRPLQAG